MGTCDPGQVSQMGQTLPVSVPVASTSSPQHRLQLVQTSPWYFQPPLSNWKCLEFQTEGSGSKSVHHPSLPLYKWELTHIQGTKSLAEGSYGASFPTFPSLLSFSSIHLHPGPPAPLRFRTARSLRWCQESWSTLLQRVMWSLGPPGGLLFTVNTQSTKKLQMTTTIMTTRRPRNHVS